MADIKKIWKHFKHLNVEMFSLFYEENGQLLMEKISKNESSNQGEIDVEKLANVSQKIKGKEVIAVHNHPFGKPFPSYPDFFQKEYIISLLRLLGVTLKDYLIVSPYGYVSFADSDLLSHENKETYRCDETSATLITTPRLLVTDDIEKHKNVLLHFLSTGNEIIVNNQEQYLSECFSGVFLLNKRANFVSKNIFIYKSNDNLSVPVRIIDINEVLEPFEIYCLSNSSFTPLKKNGFL